MKLFVKCHSCGNKIYIESSARVRSELPFIFTLRCNQENCSMNNNNEFYVSDEVFAEIGDANAINSTLVLAALGLLTAGAIGFLIGGSFGAILGSKVQQPEQKAVDTFNNSSVASKITG